MTSIRYVITAAGLVIAIAMGLPSGTVSAQPSDPGDGGSSSSEAHRSGDGSAMDTGTGQEPADQPTTSADTSGSTGPTVNSGGQEPAGVGGGQEPSDGIDSMTTLADSLRTLEADRQLTDARLQQLAENDSGGVAEMFEMQMLMNRLSQLAEMSSAVMSAQGNALAAIASGEKG